MVFTGTDDYIVSEDLKLAVNAAVTLAKPLLIKGEPGTGKTQLAEEIAKALDTELIQWHIKSTTKAQQGLYEYDAVSRLRDSQLGDERVHDISNYIVKGKMWQAFEADKRPVLLIDEIDKVSRTEAGREIISILTHLVESTQNDKFQDKYFSGIDLDLSKALFVFSYNDVNAMDRILTNGKYIVPLHYAGEDYFAFKSTIKKPEITPIYGAVLETWWMDSQN